MAKKESASCRLLRGLLSGVLTIGCATALAAAKAPVKIWVSKNDGTLQCDQVLPEATLSEAQRVLEKANVKVFKAKKRPSTMMTIALCGSPTGDENVFLILEEDFQKVERLGFKKSKN